MGQVLLAIDQFEEFLILHAQGGGARIKTPMLPSPAMNSRRIARPGGAWRVALGM
jgi:hypothetical protein